MRSALALLALLTPLTAYGADTLGRLFFTPDQRAQLDALRTKRVVASQSKEEPLPEVVTFNGIVRRSDGKTTVWVNNQALSEADLRDKPAIAGRVSRDGKILLQATQPGTARTQLKVGQSAELLSGQVAESYNATTSAAARTPKPEPAKAAPTTAGKDIETPG
ncbi:MAG: hypothetical protein RJA24_355, partial [Pseudomonadota bacterium]